MSPKFVLGRWHWQCGKKGSWSSISRFKSFVPFPALNNCNMISQVKPKFDGPTSPRMGESKHVTDSRLLKVCFFSKARQVNGKKGHIIYTVVYYIYTHYLMLNNHLISNYLYHLFFGGLETLRLIWSLLSCPHLRDESPAVHLTRGVYDMSLHSHICLDMWCIVWH